MPLTGLRKWHLSDESISDHQNETGWFFRPRLELVSNIQVGEISHQKSLKTKYSSDLGSRSEGLALWRFTAAVNFYKLTGARGLRVLGFFQENKLLVLLRFCAVMMPALVEHKVCGPEAPAA